MVHSIERLTYRLVSGRVDLEPLRILSTRQTEWNGWSVTFHVLGASHAVCLERGEMRITELLTCIAPADEPRCLLSLSEHPSSGCASVAGVEFRVQLCAEKLDSRAGLRTENLAGQILEFQFPEVDGAGPITRIEWREYTDELIVETIHTYPESGRAIRSRTVFRAREDE